LKLAKGKVSFSIRAAAFLAGGWAETWNHIPVDWNKIGLKFRRHETDNFHQLRLKV
jgi:hypothetical protein